MDTLNLSYDALLEYDQRPTGKGDELRFFCPLTEDCREHRGSGDQSLSVNISKGVYTCFRCGNRGKFGDVYPTEQEKRPVPSPNQEFRRCNTWVRPLGSLGKCAGTDYLHSRGISADRATLCDTGFVSNFFGNPAIGFFLSDDEIHNVCVQGRYISVAAPLKCRNCGPKKNGVFRTPDSLENGQPLILVESPIDALSLFECGAEAIALCGKDGLPEWLERRCAFQSVHLAFDADSEGEKAVRVFHERLGRQGTVCRRLKPPEGKDFNDSLMRMGQLRLKAWLESTLR